VRIVRQGLRVSQQKELLVAVLEGDAVSQRSYKMAEMERAGRAVAGKNDGLSDGC
jgi:hypothetical protein